MKVWKSNWVKGAAAAALLAMAGSAWADNASAQTEQQATPEQVSEQICQLVSLGAADLSALHQQGKSQAEAQQYVADAVASLQPNYGVNAQLSELFQQYWRNLVPGLYEQAPEATPERQQEIVRAVYQVAYQSCMQGAANAADAVAK